MAGGGGGGVNVGGGVSVGGIGLGSGVADMSDCGVEVWMLVGEGGGATVKTTAGWVWATAIGGGVAVGRAAVGPGCGAVVPTGVRHAARRMHNNRPAAKDRRQAPQET